MIILGLSAFYHDSAVAIVRNGEILFAAQEERFSRKKHDASFPSLALKSGLATTGLSPRDIDCVVFYEKPLLKFDRLFSTYAQFAPRGIRSFLQAMPVWLKKKLFMRQQIVEETGIENILFVKHHEAHAASAFFPSPFAEATILTIDGVGEWDTLTIGRGSGNEIDLKKAIRYPHSLGLLYSAFTYFAGFRVNSGEYKLMGLAPYGKPKYVPLIYDRLIDVKEDGSFRLNLEYFNYHIGLTMTGRKFDTLFGAKPRRPESPLRELDMDMAASIQVVLEETVAKIVLAAHQEYGGDNLVLAGGVALNCVANGKILRERIYKNIWIQPAAGDAGGALGAALYVWYQHGRNPRTVDGFHDAQQGSFLGSAYSDTEIRSFLDERKISYRELKAEEIPGAIAELVDNQKIVGLFGGRMEYGPRALGHRSIIGDARSVDMQRVMNVAIKFRESFRPFAPAVLEEKVGDYFDSDRPSRYMLFVYALAESQRRGASGAVEAAVGLDKLDIPKSTVPAVTHVDYTARIHSVVEEDNPFFYGILRAFYERTGCPVVINTSFNVRGEPIVQSPQDALRCFQNTNMDCLLLEKFLVEKRDEDRKMVDRSWIQSFPPD